MAANNLAVNNVAGAKPKPPRPVGPPDLVPPSRTGPALLLSMLVHVAAMVALGWVLARSPGGTSGQSDRPIGIALVQGLPDRTQYTDTAEAADSDQPADSQSQARPSPAQPSPESDAKSDAKSDTTASDPAVSASAIAPPDFVPEFDLDGILQSVQSSTVPVGGTGMAGETNLDAQAFGGDALQGKFEGGGNDDSGEATTVLFGISGSGSQFVYVIDRSDSMNGYGGRPLRSAKRELVQSLRSLTERQRFQLVFYNDQPTPFRLSGTSPQMIPADDNNKLIASQYVQSVNAFGATEHESALKTALRFGPDVIFFLTDARIPRLSTGQLRDIQRRCDRGGTTIHAIEFGSEPAPPVKSFLRDLAAMNRGQYRYVDISTPGGVRVSAEVESVN